MTKINSIIMAVFLFLFIYTPPILPINILHILTGISLIALLLLYNSDQYIRFVFQKNIIGLIAGTSLALLLLATILAFTTEEFIELYQIALVAFEVIPCSIVIVFTYKRLSYKLVDIINALLNVALLQAIIAMIMLSVPEFKDYVMNNILLHQNENSIFESLNVFRRFGFAMGFTFDMPVTQGFLAALAAFMSLTKSMWYFLYIPPLLISAVINARTGVMVFFICCMIILLINIKYMKFVNYSRLLILALIFTITVSIGYAFVADQSKATADWIQAGIDETLDSVTGEKTGYYQAADDMFFLPEGLDFVFGTGQNYFGRLDVKSSDIGYVNDLFMGGIAYVLLLYMSFLGFMFSGKGKRDLFSTMIVIMMITTMLVCNIKGFAFRQNCFVNLFILLSTTLSFNKYMSRNSN